MYDSATETGRSGVREERGRYQSTNMERERYRAREKERGRERKEREERGRRRRRKDMTVEGVLDRWSTWWGGRAV